MIRVKDITINSGGIKNNIKANLIPTNVKIQMKQTTPRKWYLKQNLNKHITAEATELIV